VKALIDALKAGKANVREVIFPGTSEKIGITVLTEAEIQDATFATERHFKTSGIEISATTIGTYERELNTQILCRALVDPASRSAAFRDVKELRGLLDPSAKDMLIEEYNSMADECSPSPLTLTDAQFEEIFREIKKNGTTGRDLSLRTLKGLITYLAKLPSISPKDSGSGSSE
jgi:hypothetical protein